MALSAAASSFAAPAAALFGIGTSTSTGSFTAARLEPAGAPEVAWSCPAKKEGYTATLTWAPSPSTFATGYAVEWAEDTSGPWAQLTTTPATSATQAGVDHRERRSYRVRALAHAWTSGWVEVSSRAPNPRC